MKTRSPHTSFPAVATATLLGALLCSCGKPAPEPQPASEAPASSTPAPELPPPEDSPAAPAQPAPDAPPPAEPAPAPKPTASNEPALESMQLAQPSARSNAKLSVPVDLRYSFDAEPLANQPVTLHLAAVPRVSGTNLAVSVKLVEGIQVAAAGALNAAKASANGAYRQQFSVTRQVSAPAELRVLVTMDLPQGSGFGFFSIPFQAGIPSQKLDSVKQR